MTELQRSQLGIKSKAPQKPNKLSETPDPNQTIQDVKTTAFQATQIALDKLKEIIEDPDAKSADQIRAAKEILQIVYGRNTEALRSDIQTENSAQTIADLIKRSKTE